MIGICNNFRSGCRFTARRCSCSCSCSCSGTRASTHSRSPLRLQTARRTASSSSIRTCNKYRLTRNVIPSSPTRCTLSTFLSPFTFFSFLFIFFTPDTVLDEFKPITPSHHIHCKRCALKSILILDWISYACNLPRNRWMEDACRESPWKLASRWLSFRLTRPWLLSFTLYVRTCHCLTLLFFYTIDAIIHAFNVLHLLRLSCNLLSSNLINRLLILLLI